MIISQVIWSQQITKDKYSKHIQSFEMRHIQKEKQEKKNIVVVEVLPKGAKGNTHNTLLSNWKTKMHIFWLKCPH